MPRWNDAARLLIIATSGRALAQSARRGGRGALVIDAFGDADMRAAAVQSAVAPLACGGFEPRALRAALAYFGRAGRALPLLYGSGLEAQPELLTELAVGRELLGNPPEVARAVKTPQVFFSLLDSLGIAHPPTRTGSAVAGPGWLAKDARGSGGVHVRAWHGGGPLAAGGYLQRRVNGESMSLLFVADGRACTPLGFNTLWTAGEGTAGEAGRAHPYAYAGAINRAALRPGQRAEIGAAAAALTRVLGLRGLNGLDFIVAADGGWYVLELNARPSASFELYDASTHRGLVDLHVRASRGDLPRALRLPLAPVRARRVVYAAVPVRIPQRMRWPPWCADRPGPAHRIAVRAPICSVWAQGGERGAVEAVARVRGAELLRRLEPAPDCLRRIS